MAPLAARPRLLLALCALGLHLTLGKKDAATIAREEIVERTLAEVCGDSTDLGCTGISRMQYKVNDASATPASRAKTLEEIEATLARFEVRATARVRCAAPDAQPAAHGRTTTRRDASAARFRRQTLRSSRRS